MKKEWRKLIKEGTEEKQQNRWVTVGILSGIILLIFAIAAVICSSVAKSLSFFIDLPSLLIISGMTLIVLTASGNIKHFFCGIKIALMRKCGTMSVCKAKNAFKVAMLSNIFVGGLGVAIGFISVLANLTELSNLGPKLIICILSFFYASVYNIFILVFYRKVAGMEHRA